VGCTCVERGATVTARRRRLQVRAGGGHRDADQLDRFQRQYAVGPRVGGHLHAYLGPDWVSFPELV
jgi:hypothetical protein